MSGPKVVRLDPQKAAREKRNAERRERDRQRREMKDRAFILGEPGQLAKQEEEVQGVLLPAIRASVMGYRVDRVAIVEAERFATSLRAHAKRYEREAEALRKAAATLGDY